MLQAWVARWHQCPSPAACLTTEPLQGQTARTVHKCSPCPAQHSWALSGARLCSPCCPPPAPEVGTCRACLLPATSWDVVGRVTTTLPSQTWRRHWRVGPGKPQSCRQATSTSLQLPQACPCPKDAMGGEEEDETATERSGPAWLRRPPRPVLCSWEHWPVRPTPPLQCNSHH